MNPPAAPDPDLQRRALDLAEWLAKLGGVIAAVWAAVEKIAKPYQTWRKQRLANEIRASLVPELGKLEKLSICTDRIEIVLDRQTVLFDDIDSFLHVAQTNTDRIDETNDLLDAVGFTSLNRRVDDARRQQIDEMLTALRDRQQARKRHETTAEHPIADPPP